MPIGQGDYGRGGQMGGPAVSSQKKGAKTAAQYEYKAQDARNYLSGQDQVDYDTAFSTMNKGYTGTFSPSNPNESQSAYVNSFTRMTELRKKAAEKLRGGAYMGQGEGQAKPGVGRTSLPSQEKGGLFKQLEVDQGWAANKKFMQSGAPNDIYAVDGQRDFSKPWLFPDEGL